jgi:hypothetical protein
VNEGATHSAVSVDEWMDRLELSMGQRRLDDWGDVLPPEKRDQIIEKSGDFVFGWWYELGAARRFGVCAQPVLDLAHATGETSLTRQGHEGIVDGQDVRDGHRSRLGREVDRSLHRCDIGDDASCRIVAFVVVGQSFGDAPLAHLQTLDPTGRECFSPEELSADRL